MNLGGGGGGVPEVLQTKLLWRRRIIENGGWLNEVMIARLTVEPKAWDSDEGAMTQYASWQTRSVMVSSLSRHN